MIFFVGIRSPRALQAYSGYLERKRKKIKKMKTVPRAERSQLANNACHIRCTEPYSGCFTRCPTPYPARRRSIAVEPSRRRTAYSRQCAPSQCCASRFEEPDGKPLKTPRNLPKTTRRRAKTLRCSRAAAEPLSASRDVAPPAKLCPDPFTTSPSPERENRTPMEGVRVLVKGRLAGSDLAPAAGRRFDTGGWLQSFESLRDPPQAGLGVLVANLVAVNPGSRSIASAAS
jgi:hypothetical protein